MKKIMSKAKIYIGVGHGSGDSGAVNGKRRECDDNLRLARRVKEYFKNQPVEVKFSRLSANGLDINGRCNEANKWGADYFISLHRDSAYGASGVSAYIYSKANEYTKAKAEVIVNNVSKAMGVQNRGVHKGAAGRFTDFGVNRMTNMHSCLLEVGYISSSKDNEAFDTKLDDIAKAIVISTMSVCGVDYVDPIKKGDVTGDGKVTAADARAALRGAAKIDNLSGKQKQAADVNGDGKVTADDARTILRQSAKLE